MDVCSSGEVPEGSWCDAAGLAADADDFGGWWGGCGGSGWCGSVVGPWPWMIVVGG